MLWRGAKKSKPLAMRKQIPSSLLKNEAAGCSRWSVTPASRSAHRESAGFPGSQTPATSASAKYFNRLPGRQAPKRRLPKNAWQSGTDGHAHEPAHERINLTASEDRRGISCPGPRGKPNSSLILHPSSFLPPTHSPTPIPAPAVHGPAGGKANFQEPVEKFGERGWMASLRAPCPQRAPAPLRKVGLRRGHGMARGATPSTRKSFSTPSWLLRREPTGLFLTNARSGFDNRARLR